MTAQRPDGRNSGQRVSFTRQGADRIARVVRTVEAGDKKGNGLTFSPRLRPIPQAGDSDIFRIAAFTGSWNVDSTATIEFIDPVHSNATATAINYFCGIAGGEVGVAKNASNVWHLVSWEMQEVCTTRVIDIEVELNTANCEIYRTLVTSTQKFLRLTFPFATCSTATTPG